MMCTMCEKRSDGILKHLHKGLLPNPDGLLSKVVPSEEY